MKQNETMEQKIRETIELAHDKGRMNAIVDDVYAICDRCVSPPYRQLAVNNIMRCCYRFGEVVRDMRDRTMKDTVKEYMESQGFQHTLFRSFLIGCVSGAAWLAAAILVIDLVADLVRAI